MRRTEIQWRMPELQAPATQQSATAVMPGDLTPLLDELTIYLGGTGQEVALAQYPRHLSRKQLPAMIGIDNASISHIEVILAGGTRLPFPSQNWLRLEADGDRMARLRDEPELLRWFRDTGLLASVSAARLSDRIGNGGGGEPVAGLIDYLLHIEKIRRHVRAGLQAAKRPRTTRRRGLARILDVQENTKSVVFVVAGMDGTSGNSGAQIIPYIVREQATLLGHPVPWVYLIACGPNSHRGLVEHWQANYAAGLAALRHSTRHGIDIPVAGGGRLTAIGQSPYDTVFLVDDSTRVETANQESVRVFAHRVAVILDALLDDAVRNQYLDHVAAREPHPEWGRFVTATAGVTGADRTTIHALLAAEIGADASRTLAESLSAAR